MNTIKLNINNKIATVTINRPDSLNALNGEVLTDMTETFESLKQTGEVGVVILTGAGEKAFIAGADIKEMSRMTPEEAYEYSRKGQRLTELIETFPKPVIAAVNGYALGGGCEFAMACHIRYAGENAVFGQPEVGLGLIAGFGGTQRLPRLIGKGRALELLLSGRNIRAEQACQWGLVNAVCPAEELIPAVEKLASGILRNGPAAVALSVSAVNQGLDSPLEKALEIEADQFREVFRTSDKDEGLQAFVEKRKPVFTGE